MAKNKTEFIKNGKKNKTWKILLGREKLDGKNKIAQIERIIYQKRKGAIKEVAIIDKITKITNLVKLNWESQRGSLERVT